MNAGEVRQRAKCSAMRGRAVVTIANTSGKGHVWSPAGRMDDGGQREICDRCEVGRTWPEAAKICAAEVLEVRAMYRRVRGEP